MRSYAHPSAACVRTFEELPSRAAAATAAFDARDNAFAAEEITRIQSFLAVQFREDLEAHAQHVLEALATLPGSRGRRAASWLVVHAGFNEARSFWTDLEDQLTHARVRA